MWGQGLDLHETLAKSGQLHPNASARSFVPWKWPEGTQHIPETFVPR
jgi:hypothetical protein